ncbi:DUF2750 domain-containing protein [Couchioplanes caeruleus]|uniref:DUF2750 domain-containing protein n=1 Tax=Couchioplanes caeruleus TaxID=56438 RepID=UPI0020BF24E6|nr:DUF2750 domain-containing protein [Couchioplanes caeruleus]UQU67559.1 DUF2750 domain-containing protein [Couchioplanes caeruleus]
MSQSGSQTAAFFQEIARHQVIWYVRNDQGSPAPMTGSGDRAMPYWSSEVRAQRAVSVWGGDLRVASMTLQTWRDQDLPQLAEEGLRAGLNRTGPNLVGWDFTVAETLNRLDRALGAGPYAKHETAE